MAEQRNKHTVRDDDDLETLASGETSHYSPKPDYGFVGKKD